MAAVLFVELPSANTEAAAGDRGGFFIARLEQPQSCAWFAAQSGELAHRPLPAFARERLIVPANRLQSPAGS